MLQIMLAKLLFRALTIQYLLSFTSGIVVEGFAPLGSPGRLNATSSDPVVMEDPIIKEIAARKGATPAQVRTPKKAIVGGI